MKMGIVSKDQAIDHYLSSTNPTALTKPSEMLAALKIRPWITNYLS